MITLIAESKTMALREGPVADFEYSLHRPPFEAEAAEIVNFLKNLPAAELAQRLKVSDALAVKSARLLYEFPNKSLGLPALKAFTGEVFKALDVDSLPDAARKFADGKVFIVSSLFGMLRTEDIVKPYRLDFGVDCNPSGGALANFWRQPLTVWLGKLLRRSGEKEILNLLPAEASKCIDWKLIRAFARVERPEFKTPADGGMLKTPRSGRLKQLRGLLLREILLRRLDSLREVLSLSTPVLAADPAFHRPGLPLFIV